MLELSEKGFAELNTTVANAQAFAISGTTGGMESRAALRRIAGCLFTIQKTLNEETAIIQIPGPSDYDPGAA